jgi:hypothetical protein
MSPLPRSFDEASWRLLLQRIKSGKCIPFLGAGACYGVLPLGAQIATEWADQHSYPLDDRTDLARVAQFLAVELDALYPKTVLADQLRQAQAPDFTQADEPHANLAALPLPMYITTNYDDFMFKALQAPPANKAPKVDYCRWNSLTRKEPALIESDYRASIANPLVYHFHGHAGLEQSMVLTEDDYLDFLVNMSREASMHPPQVMKALGESSLLFIGYKLADWDFRVLFRSLVNYMERSLARVHLSVQLVPIADSATDEQKMNALRYLDKFFGKSDIRIYWGTSREFVRELRQRWGDFQ